MPDVMMLALETRHRQDKYTITFPLQDLNPRTNIPKSKHKNVTDKPPWGDFSSQLAKLYNTKCHVDLHNMSSNHLVDT